MWEVGEFNFRAIVPWTLIKFRCLSVCLLLIDGQSFASKVGLKNLLTSLQAPANEAEFA
jgi:hypothetical protein